MTDNSNVVDATKAASARRKQAFNSGDAKGCAACYEQTAVMEVTPFGTFRGRDEIQGFWTKLISDGFAEVEYIDPKIEALDAQSALLTSGWKMNNAHGVITKEVWVIQDDGNALLREDAFEVQG